MILQLWGPKPLAPPNPLSGQFELGSSQSQAESGTVSPNPLKSAKHPRAALLARGAAWGPKGGAPGGAGRKPGGAARPAQERPTQPMSARGRGSPASPIRGR